MGNEVPYQAPDTPPWLPLPPPPAGCIFCGDSDLTGEHLVAEWMHPHLPYSVIPKDARDPRHRIFTSTAFLDGTVVRGKNIKGAFSGLNDIRTVTLDVVCKSCNTGWMSRLQTAVKPVLLPFIQGEWPVLSTEEQRTLSLWTVMTALVFGRVEAHEPVSHSDLTAFKDADQHRQVPDNFLLWIYAHYDDWNPVAYGIKCAAQGEGAIFDAAAIHWSLNRFGLFAVASTNQAVIRSAKEELQGMAAAVGMRTLWPATGNPLPRPPNTLMHGGAQPYVNEVARVLRHAART
jgi:hypothetical protein